MQWKDGKLVKAVIGSNLGGNLRLRVPNELKLSGGRALKKATGENPNPFYQTKKTPEPVVSPKAGSASLQLKQTFIYDIPTQRGKEYTLLGG